MNIHWIFLFQFQIQCMVVTNGLLNSESWVQCTRKKILSCNNALESYDLQIKKCDIYIYEEGILGKELNALEINGSLLIFNNGVPYLFKNKK